MSGSLTPHSRLVYQRDGIVFPIPVLTPAEVGYFRQACDELESQLGGRPRTVEVRQMHLHFPWAFQLATHPRILDAACEVLGPDVAVWATELFAKHPRDKAVSIGWHRDRTYLEFDPALVVTAWIALSPCTKDNGCMHVVLEPDRRRAGQWRTRADGENRVPDVPSEAMSPVELKPGELSLHDVHILHGSGNNNSSEKRVGLAIRFLSPAARGRADRPPALLARGHDRFGNFHWVDPPVEMDRQDALRAMRRSARQHLELTLESLKHTSR